MSTRDCISTTGYLWHNTLKHFTEAKFLDEFQSNPHITETLASLCANFANVDLNPFG